MHWVTLAHVHLDRVATPWLIRRFVDVRAEFTFLDWSQERRPPEGTIPFGMPGVELSSHDEHGTTFSKVMTAYGLTDPALVLMERIVAAGVRHAMGHRRPEDVTDEEWALGSALDSLGVGLGIVYNDADHVEHAMPLYDALYALCQLRSLPDDVRAKIPASPPERVGFLRTALERL
jgi:hypothetical protein